MLPIILNGARATSAASRLWWAVRNAWRTMSLGNKIALAAVAADVAASAIPDEKTADETMATAVAGLNTLPPMEAVDRTINAVAALTPDAFAALKTALAQDNSMPSKDAAQLITMAESRRSGTKYSGDGTAASQAGLVAAYNKMKSYREIVARAMAVLGTSDPQRIRAIRDAIFMDEQVFSAVVDDMMS